MDARNKPRILVAEDCEEQNDNGFDIVAKVLVVLSAIFTLCGVGFLLLKYHKPITLWLEGLNG
jgi:hypothetical protein